MGKFFGVEKIDSTKNNQFIPNVANIPAEPVQQTSTVVVSSVPTNNAMNVANINNNVVVNNANNNMQQNIVNNANFVNNNVVSQQPINQQMVNQQNVTMQPAEQQSNNVSNMVSAASEEVLDENVETMSAINNSTNPVPVNPVSNDVVEEVDQFDRYLISPMDCLKLYFMLLLKPGDALKDCAKKCKKFKNGIFILLNFLVVTLILALLGGAISSIFVKTFNTLSETFNVSIDFGGIMKHNYIDDLFNALLLCVLPVMVFALIYYAASFISSKGLPLGSYMGLSCLSLVPYTLGFCVLYPIGYVISDYLGIIFIGICLLYSLVLYIVGINECIDFNTSNQKIIYNGINLALVFCILFMMALLVYFDGVLPVSLLS